jgi:hypothetical protein
MKQITYIILAVSIIACSTKNGNPIDDLKEASQAELLTKLNDPSSYEFVSFQIDTLERQEYNLKLSDLNNVLLGYKNDSINKSLQISMIHEEINFHKEKSFPQGQIEFAFEFRSKNAVNAFVLTKKTVVSDSVFNFIKFK